MKTNRDRMYIRYDLLRIFASFSVVVLHVAAQNWYSLSIDSVEWFVANAYDAMFRFGVPIFVMISGALFLGRDKEIDIKRLYSKNIWRMLVIYFVWSFLYGFSNIGFNISAITIKGIVRMMIQSSYHLWFLPMLIGLYVLLPILHSWIKNASKANILYFVMGFLLLQIGRETVRALTISDEIHSALDLVQVEMMCGYVGYFVLGHYIANVGIEQKWCKWIYISCIPALIFSVVASYRMTMRLGMPSGAAYDSFSLFTFIISVAIFVAFTTGKEWLTQKIKCKPIVREIAADTFGVYLVHLLVMYFLNLYGINSGMFNNILAIPILSIIVFVISLAIAAILRRIPLIGKFIC